MSSFCVAELAPLDRAESVLRSPLEGMSVRSVERVTRVCVSQQPSAGTTPATS